MESNEHIKKIEYLKGLLDGLDSEILTLVKERISLSEDLAEYLFKNNLEENTEYKYAYSNKNRTISDDDLYEIYNEISSLVKKRTRKLYKKYLSDYAYLADQESSYLKYLIKAFENDDLNTFDLQGSEIYKLLQRDNFKGYFLSGSYKEEVIPYLDDMTDQAKEISSVNLVQKYRNRNFGFNTEFVGLIKLFQAYGVNLQGEKVLVLGDRVNNKVIEYTLNKLNVASATYVGIEAFQEVDQFDHNILINTIDFDDIDIYKKIDLEKCINLEKIFELSTRDFFTRLMIDGRDRGIEVYNGFYKDLHQNKKSMEILLRRKFDDEYFEDILNEYIYENLNIVLVGMPGAGKTTIGKKLGKLLKRRHVDLDREFYFEYGIFPEEYLSEFDEESFRQKEKKVVEKLGSLKGVVISTSGGAVSKLENYYHLKKNSIIFMIERDLSYLSTRNRPLSQGGLGTLVKMKKERQENYSYFADYTFENKGNFNQVAFDIKNKFDEIKIY